MAAVVKVKTQNHVPDDVENTVANKVTKKTDQLSMPLLREHDEQSDAVVIDVDEPSEPVIENNHMFLQNGCITSNVSEDIEDGEVIGIITLEDVFEELLQVKSTSL